jgi:hypothetical protein
MVVNCKRGDEFKCHLFLDTNIAGSLLLEKSDPARVLANNVLFHELAHVWDFGRIAKEVPNAFPNHLSRWPFLLTNATWSKYYACFATAQQDPSLDDYVTTFLNSLRQCPDEVQEVIAYRNYNDMNDLMEFVKDRIGLVFKLAGYVLGHLAGIDRQLSDTHPEAWQSIEEAGFADTWLQLNVALKEMLDMPSWKDASVYDGLARCAINYLRTQGLYLEDQGKDFM